MVKGMPLVEPTADDGRAADGSDPMPVEEIDLGPAGPETTLRPMQRVPITERSATTDRTATPAAGPRPWWRDPRVLAVVAGAALLVVGAVVFGTRGSGNDQAPTGDTQAVAATVTQQDPPAPTGLTISRAADYDPQSQTVELTITYAAQNAALAGPFLEVIPGNGGTCPTPQWDGVEQEPNLPSSTGVTTACAWSVDPGRCPHRATSRSRPGCRCPSTARTRAPPSSRG